MKLAIDPKIKENFNALKFDKNRRFLTYKVNKEQVVNYFLLR